VLQVRDEGGAQTTVEHQSTASIGVALFGRQDVSQGDILTRADRVMYQAKEAGCNLIRFFDQQA
jgi:GGDEF domain-containing protein